MISKETLKKEIDLIPETLLEKIHIFIQNELRNAAQQTIQRNGYLQENWVSNLDEFTPDFMETREQYPHQHRESLD